MRMMGVSSSSSSGRMIGRRQRRRGRTVGLALWRVVVTILLPCCFVLNITLTAPIVVWAYQQEETNGAGGGVDSSWMVDQDQDEPLEENHSLEGGEGSLEESSRPGHRHFVVEHHREQRPLSEQRELQAAQCDGEEVDFTQVLYVDLVGVRGVLGPRAMFYYQRRLVQLYNERLGASTGVTCVTLTNAQATAQTYQRDAIGDPSLGFDSENNNRNLQRGSRLRYLAATLRAKTVINGRCRACNRRDVISDLILNGRTQRQPSPRRDLVFVNETTTTTSLESTTTTATQEQDPQEQDAQRWLQEAVDDGFDDILLDDLIKSQVDDFGCIIDVIFHNDNPSCSVEGESTTDGGQRVNVRTNNDNNGGPSSTTPKTRKNNRRPRE